MAIKRFAVIDVGSYESAMKIFEVSPKGVIEIDHIRHMLEIGRDTYRTGSISYENIEEICKILYRFGLIMKEYRVDDYRAKATSAIREAKNSHMVLDRIRVKTGLEVKVLSNSEQRFLCFKALASMENEFNKMIQKPTAIVDVSSGSVQISLYDKDVLVVTQNIRLGSLRLREMLDRKELDWQHIMLIMEELINNDFETLQKIFLKDREIKNIIAVGDYITYFTRFAQKEQVSINGFLSREEFIESYRRLEGLTMLQVAEKLNISVEHASLLIPSLLIYKKALDYTQTEMLWTSDICLCDGIAASYAQKHCNVNFSHDFIKDILNASYNLAKRYRGNIGHTELLEEGATAIYDTMKKYHGLGKRERLLLQIATILHDCGKYISMTQPGECSYNIIMATELIGLSHNEREIVANVVRYNTREFDYKSGTDKTMSNNMYLTVAKLTAILRIANAMDRSHRQKLKKMKIFLKQEELIIQVDTMEDISLELALFSQKADFFEEVYGVRPVLKRLFR